MISQRIRKSFILNDLLFQIILACGFGLLLGITCGVFTGLLVFEITASVFFIYAILKRPEIALLGILISTSSVVFEDQLPLFSAGGISLHIPDFLLVGMLGLIAVRWLVEPGFKILRTPLGWPLLIFYGITLFWTFNAIFHSSVDVETSRRMIRVVTYYMTFFVVTNLVRERRQLNFLLNGLFLLATLVAAVMVVQYVLGRSVTILPGRVEALNTQGSEFGDVSRILPPGLSIVLVAFVTTFCVLLLEKFKPTAWLSLLQFGLLGTAILFTFLRSYWGTMLISFSLLVFILRGHDRQKLFNWSMLLIFSAVVMFFFISSTSGSKVSGLVNASLDRFSTVFSIETYRGQDSSLNWREIENKYALRQIISHPLVGLGLGSRYRPYDSRLDQSGNDLRWFIHNGHYWILLDSGLLGYLAFMGLSLAFLMRGFRYWKNVVNYRLKGIVLGFTLIYLTVLIAAVLNSTFTMWYWTPVIGTIMGINEVILLKFWQEE
jgi:hypothetical protein